MLRSVKLEGIWEREHRNHGRVRKKSYTRVGSFFCPINTFFALLMGPLGSSLPMNYSTFSACFSYLIPSTSHFLPFLAPCVRVRIFTDTSQKKNCRRKVRRASLITAGSA